MFFNSQTCWKNELNIRVRMMKIVEFSRKVKSVLPKRKNYKELFTIKNDDRAIIEVKLGECIER